ncbi:unnamed protein product [Angiostrongylus costaricensis]|uniref:Uncharacterized protein n=1 Tax=Angiostrongylus costaricensis TaxID=334426 RepID=A0A3P7HIE9_ANGCS|nr:unnamed protein product [Angiostrongylus costaricensis]
MLSLFIVFLDLKSNFGDYIATFQRQLRRFRSIVASEFRERGRHGGGAAVEIEEFTGAAALHVPSDEKHFRMWRLFDMILQHLTLQTTVQGMTDVENCDYERLESEVERLKEDLDQERMRVVELDNRIADLHDGRASISSSRSTTPSSTAWIGSDHAQRGAQKRVPKPSGPLKSLNWVKFTESKVKGTAWEFIEDEKMYKQVQLSVTFSNLWLIYSCFCSLPQSCINKVNLYD